MAQWTFFPAHVGCRGWSWAWGWWQVGVEVLEVLAVVFTSEGALGLGSVSWKEMLIAVAEI